MSTVVSLETRTNTPGLGHITGANALEDIQHVTHLLSLSQTFCGQMNGGVERLCQEVALVTQGRIQLCLSRQKPSKRAQRSSVTFPVQFGNTVYGTLSMTSSTDHPDILPLPIVQHLAQVCSWLLYTLEQSAFLEGQCQQLEYNVHKALTKREREVVLLMCRGHTKEEIAQALSISPATVRKHRQHIYDQLGVHNERDALLVAYHVGLFSIIEDSF